MSKVKIDKKIIDSINNKPFSLSNKTFSELQNKINNKNSGYYVIRKRILLDEDKIIQTLVIEERIVNGVIKNCIFIYPK